MSSSKIAGALLASLALVVAAPSAHAQDTPSAASAAPAATTVWPKSLPRKKRALIWEGATLFALPYLASALVATTGYPAADSMASPRVSLWVPCAGPFVMMGTTKYASLDVLLALDGLAQIGGLTMFVYALTLPRLVAAPPPQAWHLSVAPLVSQGGAGATLFTAF